ncbi:hypothetical protein ACK1CN_21980 [Vibrio coralliilyticus]|uniref:Uncharacterized protein n=2 Tax=Vibrio coralliilyticus TaxID=190893 RepID=A0AAP7DFD5_9VIBR|nr:hypothetical protein [Vibrio coralliilyticus]AIS58433.1 hypothetical protein JV59_25870 [Vibrio coralliilyticus]ERB66434.1 hypothetical protein N779_05170 [Vibrio coralliilyticus OCN008]NOJ24310.1 hypothetical protein [Vibrio coralliilyticus]NRF16499.1 hypothetical protein [Vibrio coralliilyticus]
MSQALNADVLYRTIDPLFTSLIHAHQHESLYALVIDQGALFIHTEAGWQRTWKAYQRWWADEHVHLEDWASFEDSQGRRLNTWNDLETLSALFPLLPSISGNATHLRVSDKAAVLSAVNTARQALRQPQSVEQLALKQHLRHCPESWEAQYMLPFYGLDGFEEAAYQHHCQQPRSMRWNSEYYCAMETLLARLLHAPVLAKIKSSEGFYALVMGTERYHTLDTTL